MKASATASLGNPGRPCVFNVDFRLGASPPTEHGGPKDGIAAVPMQVEFFFPRLGRLAVHIHIIAGIAHGQP